MSERQDRFMTGLELAGQLLPELVQWVQAMRAAGKSDDDIRRDIRDRTSQIRSNRAAVDTAIDDKFSTRPPTGSHAVPPRGALDSNPPAAQPGDDDGRA